MFNALPEFVVQTLTFMAVLFIIVLGGAALLVAPDGRSVPINEMYPDVTSGTVLSGLSPAPTEASIQ
jgi:hypothetical protein